MDNPLPPGERQSYSERMPKGRKLAFELIQEIRVRKIIVMAVIGYLWKRLVANKTRPPNTIAELPETQR